jgi:type II secretion system protein C
MARNFHLGALPALPRVNPKLFRHLCAVAALVFLAYFAAQTVVSLTGTRPLETAAKAPGTPDVRQAAPAPRPKSLSTYEQIVAVNIFGGDARGQAAPEEIDLQNIPLALDSLKLRLVGTAVGADGTANVAFIEDLQAKSQDMYREGEQVKNVTIKRILRSSVVINTGKRDEILTMDAEPGAGGGPAQRAAPGRGGSRRNVAEADVVESRNIERGAVESSLENLSQLMQDAQIDTYIENGKPSGFRFSNIRPDSFYSRLGLRNDDIITSINGRELTDPSQFLNLKENISDGSVALTIKRGGAEQVIQYDLSE